ncbi:serine hydrolase [Williamsia sp. CHRR-6]|uniref:serine hydrolase domain-containing protein n=1 Tax=Williamsia sp. CHRR-6 TaxID=2835871 RepID=UPI001BDACDC1|nr:serine hydrolase domain-containing protein [Williamsia sp. CHRR-6]MBT0565360.1 beta-lactamase family protein [Williamsia sp. CHRR-6]
MTVLDQLASWPVDSVAAAVIVGDAVVETFGPTGSEFALASVTKPLTAYAVLVGVEEGALALDTAAGPTGSTVEHLLAHASGLPFEGSGPQAAVATQRIYSNSGFDVLAQVLERATGIGFADYLAEAVCSPLELGATRLIGTAGAGAYSCVDDLARFAAELLMPRLLARETLADATSVHFPGLDGFVPGFGRHRPNDWGLGVEIRGHKSPHWTAATNSPRTFGHFGQAGTFLWVDPDLGGACVVLTDRPFGSWAKPLWSQFNAAVVADIRASQASR